MYTVKDLARLTGLTPRTLRYYDAIGLLCPRRGKDNDYRLYGPDEVDRLQQILLYRDMGLPLEEIKCLLDAPEFDHAAALREHLSRLLERRREVDALIRAVQNTLNTIAGGTTMTDMEKFEGMKRQAIRENEAAYGKEWFAHFVPAENRSKAKKQCFSGRRHVGWLYQAFEMGFAPSEPGEDNWKKRSGPAVLYLNREGLAFAIENAEALPHLPRCALLTAADFSWTFARSNRGELYFSQK